MAGRRAARWLDRTPARCRVVVNTLDPREISFERLAFVATVAFDSATSWFAPRLPRIVRDLRGRTVHTDFSTPSSLRERQ
jgi:hypothetical protein